MYKVKFLESLQPNAAGDEYVKNYHEQAFDENGIKNIAKSFKILGFIKVASIELLKGAKMTFEQVVELFYPEITGDEPISDKDKAFKNELLKSNAKENDDDKEKKSELRAQIKELGGTVSNAATLEQLQAKLDELIKQ